MGSNEAVLVALMRPSERADVLARAYPNGMSRDGAERVANQLGCLYELRQRLNAIDAFA